MLLWRTEINDVLLKKRVENIYDRFFHNKRPFAARGHMVQNPKYWRAKECDETPLGNANAEYSHFSS